jgi:hypothetical protein
MTPTGIVKIEVTEVPKKLRKVFTLVEQIEQFSLEFELDPKSCRCEDVVSFLIQMKKMFEEVGINPRDAIPTTFDRKIKTSKARSWIGLTRVRMLFFDDAINALSDATAKVEDDQEIGQEVIRRAYPFLLLAVRARCMSCFSDLRHTCQDCKTVI